MWSATVGILSKDISFILKNMDKVESRDDHFRFGSVFIKKINQTKFFLKKNRNWTATRSNRPVPVRFFRAKTGSNRFGSVFSVLARFFRFWLGFLGFGSVFRFLLGFFGLAWFFWFGSVFFPVFFSFGSVFWFFAYETEPNRLVFLNFNRFNWFFFLFGFFGYFFAVFSV
jgi:hypothetical protein